MIEIRGVEELLAKLVRLEKLQGIVAVMRAAALYVKGKLAKYPPQKQIRRDSVYDTSFQTIKQQRFFFASLADGTLDVPYHRGESASSEALGRSWTITDEDGGLTQIIGNDTSYGPFVMGDEDEQSLFMAAIGWQRANDIADQYEDYVVQKVQEGLEKELNS